MNNYHLLFISCFKSRLEYNFKKTQPFVRNEIPHMINPYMIVQ